MNTRRGGLRNAAASLFWTALTVALVFQVARRWLLRYEVEGHSMLPTLMPGDWLFVHAYGPRDRQPRAGQIVLARDPHEPSRVLLKRVSGTREDLLWLLGDNPEASTDSRAFGPVARSALVGYPWFRYWPLRRAGRV